MKKIIFPLVCTTVLTACATYDTTDGSYRTTKAAHEAKLASHSVTHKIAFYSVECEKEVRGGSDEKFWYGDSSLRAKPKSNVGQDTEYRIELKPSSGYEHSVVTTTCVSATPIGTDCTWLNKSQQESVSKYMIFCVPDDVPIGASFKYDISVPTIGTLDPRIDVTW